jgi:hypothetical protein
VFNEQANKEYIETQFEIQVQIERLQDTLADHNQTARIHWGHVGDMKHILNQLKQINEEEE